MGAAWPAAGRGGRANSDASRTSRVGPACYQRWLYYRSVWVESAGRFVAVEASACVHPILKAIPLREPSIRLEEPGTSSRIQPSPSSPRQTIHEANAPERAQPVPLPVDRQLDSCRLAIASVRLNTPSICNRTSGPIGQTIGRQHPRSQDDHDGLGRTTVRKRPAQGERHGHGRVR